MNIMYERRKKRQKSVRITDYVETYLEKERKQTGRYTIYMSSLGYTTLEALNRHHVVVNLNENNYICGDFQELQMPCRHGQ